MDNRKKIAGLMFLIGLGSATRVYLGGAIAISEIFIFVVAPYIFFKNYIDYKKNDICLAICLPILMIGGCFIACKVNDVPMLAFIKSTMTFYSIAATIVVFYYLVRRNLYCLGWFYVGAFISSILAIFMLNPAVSTDGRTTELIGQADIETTINGVMFWYNKILAAVKLPALSAYLKVPLVLSIAPIVCGSFVVPFISVSGRSAAATSLVSAALMGAARKSRNRMFFLGRHFLLFLAILGSLVLGIKQIYVYAAKNGVLSEEAQNKFEHQTQGNDSLMKIIMGGRCEFFIMARALVDAPIIGLGPYALDNKGYQEEFLEKYGTQKDLELYYHRLYTMGASAANLLPRHSTLCQFWCDAGIIGLLFSLYYLYLVFSLFRKYSGAIPQWFGYFAVVIPSSLFAFFFNPYTDRFGLPLQIVCILIARAVYKKRIVLPYNIEMEARKYE